MKIRMNFVSNSSSSSYIVFTTKKLKTLEDIKKHISLDIPNWFIEDSEETGKDISNTLEIMYKELFNALKKGSKCKIIYKGNKEHKTIKNKAGKLLLISDWKEQLKDKNSFIFQSIKENIVYALSNIEVDDLNTKVDIWSILHYDDSIKRDKFVEKATKKYADKLLKLYIEEEKKSGITIYAYISEWGNDAIHNETEEQSLLRCKETWAHNEFIKIEHS